MKINFWQIIGILLVIGGAIAYQTTKAKVAMIGNLIPINNPIRVAEEIALLDIMCGGRCANSSITGQRNTRWRSKTS